MLGYANVQVTEEGGEAEGQEDGCLEGAERAAGQGPEDEAEEVSFSHLPRACTTLLMRSFKEASASVQGPIS